MPMVLGVESAAAATKVELRDADDGHLYASGKALHSGDAAAGEQDPNIWWQALVEARHEAGGALGVGAVGVAAQQQGLVVLDGDNKVLRPARLSDDVAGATEADELVELLGGPTEWAVAVGSVPDASFPIAKLAWLRRAEPRRFASVAKVLTPHDWLTYRLSRQFVTDRGDASGTGYWSPRENGWRADLLAYLDDAKDWSSCLPHVAGPHEPAGDREGVIIAPGTGATMGAALGLALQPRDLAMMLGPSATVFTVRERPTEDPTGAVAGLADASGRFLPQVHTRNGLNVTDAVARVLGVDRSRFNQLALSAPPGAGGVTIVPYFNGERVPPRPNAAGVIAGLRGDVTAEQLARAAVEGVICSLLDSVDALRAADVPVGGRISLIGDGARSHAFQRILADLSQRRVAISQGERVATGACVQAAAVLHDRPPAEIAEAWRLAPTREYEPETHGDAETVRAQYREAQSRL